MKGLNFSLPPSKLNYGDYIAKHIVSQDSRLYIASLDVDLLFTNIPLEETINICVDQLFLNSLVTAESYFIFDGVCYKQLDGVAMGSPLGPTLANASLF